LIDRSFDAATSLQIRTPARKTGVRIFLKKKDEKQENKSKRKREGKEKIRQ